MPEGECRRMDCRENVCFDDITNTTLGEGNDAQQIQCSEKSGKMENIDFFF